MSFTFQMAKILCILLMSMCLSVGAEAGGDVGNGGDVIKCRADGSNKSLSGVYSLDYVLTLQGESRDIVPTNSWQASMYRIRKNLESKVPELLQSFDDFNRYVRSSDKSQRRYWEPTDLRPIDIKDEAIEGKLVEIPDNCKNGDIVSLIQAVVRQPPGTSGSNQVVYVYMPPMFDQLASQAPLQLSFLLIHEWLWDVSQDVTRNRRINRFLHSEGFDQMSSAQVRDTLLGMGLNVDTIPRIVDRRGAGHFRSLSEALVQSRDGETLIVKPGVYSEGNLRITRPVKIAGEGNAGDVVIDTDDGLHLSGDGIVFENLTFRRKVFGHSSENDFQQAAEVLGGYVKFEKVKIEGGLHGLVLHEGARVEFTNGEIHTTRRGVWMDYGASGRFYNNLIDGNYSFRFYGDPPEGPDLKDSNFVEIVGNTLTAGFDGKPRPDSILKDNQFIGQ